MRNGGFIMQIQGMSCFMTINKVVKGEELCMMNKNEQEYVV